VVTTKFNVIVTEDPSRRTSECEEGKGHILLWHPPGFAQVRRVAADVDRQMSHAKLESLQLGTSGYHIVNIVNKGGKFTGRLESHSKNDREKKLFSAITFAFFKTLPSYSVRGVGEYCRVTTLGSQPFCVTSVTSMFRGS
jgi:hypothetical protein